MTDPPDEEATRGWNLFGKWQEMAQPFTDLAAVNAWPMWGSRASLQAVLEFVRSRLVGRAIVVGTGENQVGLTLSSIDATLTPGSAAAGQAEVVRLTAEDLEWKSIHFPDVTATLRNVHTRVGTQPGLVAAPVDVRVTITEEGLAALVDERLPKVALGLTEQGLLRVHLTRHPKWGSVELLPSVEKGSVVVRATGLARAARRRQFKHAMPPVRLKIGLPESARIITVEGYARHLEVQFRVDEWRLDYRDLLNKALKKSP